MKHLFITIVAIALGQSAFAKTSGGDFSSSETTNFERQISAEELTLILDEEDANLEDQLLQSHNQQNNKIDLGDIFRDVLTDAIRDQVLGRDIICEAQNRSGRIFRAHGHRPQRVQHEALQRCRESSRRPRTCEKLGCRRGRRF
ncbi:MAG: hypothetical protein KDD50_16320 [Bdellovibrionales bacterium]|nr:hypothetical protein [Bdellovibrionales bacterium]